MQIWLPPATQEYNGSMIAFYFLVIVAAVGTGRSLMHIFAADGGANSIAGLAVDVEGGTNIIAIFAQWGASQLILAIFYWLAILRYRFLTPFMLSVVVLEQLLRMGAGQLKPVVVASSPPGEIGNYILLPLGLIALFLSLRGNSKAA
jgi:hypothetical protein